MIAAARAYLLRRRINRHLLQWGAVDLIGSYHNRRHATPWARNLALNLYVFQPYAGPIDEQRAPRYIRTAEDGGERQRCRR